MNLNGGANDLLGNLVILTIQISAFLCASLRSLRLCVETQPL